MRPELMDWSDVSEFVQLTRPCRRPQGAIERIAILEEARDLYRGDLFDDCPFYGDSVLVEERREYLRIRQEDLLIELGELHAASDDEAQALTRFRQALQLNPESARARSGDRPPGAGPGGGRGLGLEGRHLVQLAGVRTGRSVRPCRWRGRWPGCSPPCNRIDRC